MGTTQGTAKDIVTERMQLVREMLARVRKESQQHRRHAACVG